MVTRITCEPWVTGDLEVPAGEVRYCMVSAANQDPAGNATGAAFVESRWRPMINVRGLQSLWLSGTSSDGRRSAAA